MEGPYSIKKGSVKCEKSVIMHRYFRVKTCATSEYAKGIKMGMVRLGMKIGSYKLMNSA